jgi:malonyl-CoA/methylmalonyl-CoA synthetase
MKGALFGWFRSRLPAPDATFIVTPAGARLTYAGMLAESGRMANLLAGFGVTPGARVAVQVEKSPAALLLYLASLRTGAVYLPLNPAYTDREVRYFLQDAAPQIFICDPARAAALGKAAADAGVAHVRTLDADGTGTFAWSGLSPDHDDRDLGEDDLAAILYTSGTTGRPKGAMLSQGNLRSNAEALAGLWRFTAGDVLLHALPIFHTHGLFVATNVTLAAGSSLYLMPGFDADAILEALPDCTVMMGVPTFYTRLLARDALSRERVAHMRLFVSGSAPLSAATHAEFHARTSHVILERYGMTETNMITSNPYDGERRPGTVGLPLTGVEVRIADPVTGTALPAGEVGMIEVRGPGVFKGYWRDPAKTRLEFRDDGFFVTGDLGRRDEDGYLAIVGRSRDLVISGGFNVYPAEVEAALDSFPEIAESAVIGVPHHDFGEAVAAVVVLRDGTPIGEEEIRKRLSAVLARYKIPKRIAFVDRLPRNAMGKVRKDVLRNDHAGLVSGGSVVT